MTPEDAEKAQKVQEQREWLEELEEESHQSDDIEPIEFRDPGFKRNGKRYVVSLGDEQIKLSLVEATELAAHLLTHLPSLANGQDLAHLARYTPELRLFKLYSYNGQEVVQDRYRAEVRLNDRSLYMTKPANSPVNAKLEACRWYGRELSITQVIDSAASKKKAEKEGVMQAAERYAAEQGISMTELWQRVAQEQNS